MSESTPLGSLPEATCTLPIPDTIAWRRAEREGIDIALLFRSIQMTPEERMKEHTAALHLVDTLRRAVIVHDAQNQQSNL